MTANASPIRRILASAAALLMLQWNALAFGAGGFPVGIGGFDSLAPAAPTEPFVLAEIGPPVAAKERSSPEKAPPSAEGVAIAFAGAEVGPPDPHHAVDGLGETKRPTRFARPFDARAPPRRT